MITDPVFYLCAIPAVLAFGMAKGGLGGSVSMLAVPLLALVVSPLQAAAILLPILVVMDVIAVWSFRGRWHRQNLRYTLPGALAGTAVAALTFDYIDENSIRLLIGIMALGFCLNYWLVERRNPRQTRPDPLRGNIWGAVAGFTSFSIHQGGPPISVYLLPQQLEKTQLMATFALFFLVVNLAKLLPYTWLGLFNSSNLLTSLALMPLAPVGVRLGYWLLHRIDERWIYRLCYWFLFAMGIKLSADGLAGI